MQTKHCSRHQHTDASVIHSKCSEFSYENTKQSYQCLGFLGHVAVGSEYLPRLIAVNQKDNNVRVSCMQSLREISLLLCQGHRNLLHAWLGVIMEIISQHRQSTCFLTDANLRPFPQGSEFKLVFMIV